MIKYYFFAIPIIVGIVVGFFAISSVEDSDNETKLTTQKLIENGSPVMGNSFAPITILEWGDYQCTFCYKFHQSSLDIIKTEYIETGKIKLIFKDFPLNGPDSVLAAEASHCADDQGKYWKYHDEVYSNWVGERTGWITRNSLNEFALNVGIDTVEFNECMDMHKYKNRVLELEKFGKEIGIKATPSFLIFNAEKIIKIEGNQPIDVFRQVIDDL